MALVDVVVVAHESRRHLRACTAPLADLADVTVTVVDNASTDGGAGPLAGLDVELFELPENRGFAAGCNIGWRAGTSPYVLLLNPDVRIEEHAVRRLVRALDEHRDAAGVGPMILGSDRATELSQGRFPSLPRTYARAFFLHRLLPAASWSDMFVRDEVAYARPGRCDWATGACLLLRRTALEQVGGLDERFFLYCEDVDLCFRLRRVGWDLRYEPDAVVCIMATRGRSGRTAFPTLPPAARDMRVSTTARLRPVSR